MPMYAIESRGYGRSYQYRGQSLLMQNWMCLHQSFPHICLPIVFFFYYILTLTYAKLSTNPCIYLDYITSPTIHGKCFFILYGNPQG